MRQESFKKGPLWYDMLLMLNWNKNTLGTKKIPKYSTEHFKNTRIFLKISTILIIDNQSVIKPYIAINMRNFKVDNA